MKIEVDINEKYEKIKVIIKAPKMDEEVNEVIRNLSLEKEPLKVYLDEEIYFIKEKDIEIIYAETGKVYIKTDENTYQSKKRLYELEETNWKISFFFY